MKQQLRQDFQNFLKRGAYCTPPGRTACAIQHARILADWREAESAGLVRLQAEPEQSNYFDVYGKPDSDREYQDTVNTLERLGCWVVYSEVNNGSEYAPNWELADSIGMCVYDNPLDPFENCYVVDLMRAALSQIQQPGNVDELCDALHA